LVSTQRRFRTARIGDDAAIVIYKKFIIAAKSLVNYKKLHALSKIHI